jgi:pimeloyl-ACP methyl ester carboxylesterase
MASQPKPFTCRIPDADIDDLHRRLDATRYASDEGMEPWRFGIPTAELREWVEAWRAFDWRAAEAELNAWPNYVVDIGGTPIHYVHLRSRRPDAVPLVLTHGWPWTFDDWRGVAQRLMEGGDAGDHMPFDLVIPSLPGTAFSSPLTTWGIGFVEIAAMWVELMCDVLGYPRFGAVGGDTGIFVSSQLGHAYADRLVGIQLFGAVPLSLFPRTTGNAVIPTGGGNYGFTPPETPPTDPILNAPVKSRPQTAHILAHALEGQTLAAAVEDSPAGLAAWIIHRRHTWSDTDDVAAWYGRDFILTLLSLYWYTRTSGTSFRKYQAMVFNAWEPAHDRTPVVEAPTGITFFDNDTGTSQSRFWVPEYYNVARLGRSEVGGHFAPSEVPDVAAREIVATFELLGR